MIPGGTFFAPYPYEVLGAHRSPEVILGEMELMLKTMTPASETAAVIIEPVLGEGGYYPAPLHFMKELREFCHRHDILLIADEVQSGFGRTGKMFAVEHGGVDPDILIMAKGIASGYPLSAIACRSELSAAQLKGSMGGTYGGNVVSCAAALATLEASEADGILNNVVERGDQLRKRLDRIKAASEGAIIDVRGPGLMVGVEFDPAHSGIAGRVSKECVDRDLLLMSTGVRETMGICAPSCRF